LGRSGGSNATWGAVPLLERGRSRRRGAAAPAASTAPGRCCLQAGRWGRRLQFIIYISYVSLMVLQLIYYLIMWKRPACPPTQAGTPCVRRPACPLCACALLPETWGLGASPWGALLGWQQRHRGRRARGGRCPQTRAGTPCVATAPLAPTAPARCCLLAACHLRCMRALRPQAGGAPFRLPCLRTVSGVHLRAAVAGGAPRVGPGGRKRMGLRTARRGARAARGAAGCAQLPACRGLGGSPWLSRGSCAMGACAGAAGRPPCGGRR
jgi:hypothetical protein